MGFAHFIARRILRSTEGTRSERISRPIVAIAVVGVVLGMAVMIVTLGFTAGFQGEVRSKTVGAGAHFQITSLRQTDPKETPRIPIAQPFYPSITEHPGVEHIQVYATKPGIIETDEDIQGVVVKGVGTDHDWRFLRRHLLTGDLPAIGDSARPIDVMISQFHAQRLRIGVDDTITIYLVRDRQDIRPRRFRVSGVYRTGLEQIDHNLVYTDIGHLQRFSQWGLKAELQVYDSVSTQGVLIEGLAFGGDRVYRYHWPGTDLRGPGPHWIRTDRDTVITLVVSDANRTIPDTAWVRLVPDTTALADLAWATRDRITVERGGSGGSHVKYCGGFEVSVRSFDDLFAVDTVLFAMFAAQRIRDNEPGLRALSVRDRFPEIFAWLELLDTNVIVIIVLMVVVAIINMTSALLIIILERTPMIGVLKALGASTSIVRRIFLIDAAYIIGSGIVLGNILGIGLCLVQQHFGLVRLPVETYYVDVVPIHLEPLPVIALSVGTLLVCVAALVVPSMLVARIAPARAIRFA